MEGRSSLQAVQLWRTTWKVVEADLPPHRSGLQLRPLGPSYSLCCGQLELIVHMFNCVWQLGRAGLLVLRGH